MKRVIFKLICLILLSFTSHIEALIPSLDYDLQVGLRHDELKWTIAGYQGYPNILSELQWKNIESIDFGGHLKIISDKNYYIRAAGNYGLIFSGNNQDSDYAANNRKKEFSRSLNDASGGEVFDLSLGIGYHYNFFNERLTVAPLIGYVLSEQHLKMRKGFQKINTMKNPYLGPFSGLNSSYKAKWSSPFLGVDVTYKLTPNVIFLSTLEYREGDYSGLGHWNLRYDFYRDFEHSASFSGFFGSIGILCSKTEALDIGLTLNYEDLDARKGRDKTYLLIQQDNKIIPVIAYTRLNSVKWRALSLLLYLKYNF